MPSGYKGAKPSKSAFVDRSRYLTCNECGGRSFHDPTKEWHWRDCSKYTAWRFGRRRLEPITPPRPIETVTANFDSVMEDYYRELPGGGEHPGDER